MKFPNKKFVFFKISIIFALKKRVNIFARLKETVSIDDHHGDTVAKIGRALESSLIQDIGDERKTGLHPTLPFEGNRCHSPN